jgi:hypothetical protein
VRRHNIPRIPPRLCIASHHFGNRCHDCLSPRVFSSAVANRCLRKRQVRRYNIHVTYLGASAPIKYRHVPTGGTAPPLQSRQVQISSKPRKGKGIGPTCEFTASPKVGLGATVYTLQTGYPHAQDLSLVPQHQTPHPAGKGSGVAACPHLSRSAPGTRDLYHHHVPRGTGHAT